MDFYTVTDGIYQSDESDLMTRTEELSRDATYK